MVCFVLCLLLRPELFVLIAASLLFRLLPNGILMPLSKAILIKVVFIGPGAGCCGPPEKCYRYQKRNFFTLYIIRVNNLEEASPWRTFTAPCQG